MNFQNWEELRSYTIGRFNDELPHPVTEGTLIEAYALHPASVEKAIDAVAADLAAGRIRSGWAILLKRCESILTPVANPTRSSSLDREKRITRTEQFIRVTGCHYDSSSELVGHLSEGGGALLPNLEQETALRERLLALWRERRPVAQALEADALERAEHWKQTTGRTWGQRKEQHDDRNATADERRTTAGAELPRGRAADPAAHHARPQDGQPNETRSGPRAHGRAQALLDADRKEPPSPPTTNTTGASTRTSSSPPTRRNESSSAPSAAPSDPAVSAKPTSPPSHPTTPKTGNAGSQTPDRKEPVSAPPSTSGNSGNSPPSSPTGRTSTSTPTNSPPSSTPSKPPSNSSMTTAAMHPTPSEETPTDSSKNSPRSTLASPASPSSNPTPNPDDLPL